MNASRKPAFCVERKGKSSSSVIWGN
jgi:hypothetical protein